ncbi:hypothetical protein O3Q51_08105 [Cryomorphaceae bacterium 1068]|nr:hypothetical protein [Cryomorphaceae bacterium 1068]
MEKITRHNYEAFFLDYLEGNLSEELNTELQAFLSQNPDLASELEEFENVSLEPESDPANWNELKVPSFDDLTKNESLREQLYFRCAEGNANEYDKKLLAELLAKDQFKDEYALWQKLKLASTAESVDREGLYQLPLSLPITSANYEDFLVARTEGILSREENQALENYASGVETGEKDLALADQLKLEAPKGIFYPFKDELKKKEKKGLVLFYRAAAIILLVGLSASLVFLLNQPESADPRYAQREVVQSTPDTLKAAESQEEFKEDSIPDDIEAEKYQLEEWEIREPDPVFVAENEEPEIEREAIPKMSEVQEDLDELEFAESLEFESPVNEQVTLPDSIVEVRDEVEPLFADRAPETTSVEYQTIGEMAETRVADELNLSDQERDEMALSVAKRITHKAGEALDSELKKEVDDEGDRLTYSLRIRGFKVSHSTKK